MTASCRPTAPTTPLLVVLLFLCLFAVSTSTTAAAASQEQQRPQRLRDVRKLQPGHWLKVAARHIPSSKAAQQPDDAACLRDYGQLYVERWRALQATYCNSTTTPSSTASSHVQCYAHPTADLSTCLARNLLLTSAAAFLGGEGTPHSSELPQPAPGSIQLACSRTTDAPSFLRGRLSNNEGMRAWLVTAPSFGLPQHASTAGTQVQQSCSGAHAVAHPVLFLLRVDPQNSFHNLEAVVSVFAGLAVLQLDAAHLRHGMEVGSSLAGWLAGCWFAPTEDVTKVTVIWAMPGGQQPTVQPAWPAYVCNHPLNSALLSGVHVNKLPICPHHMPPHARILPTGGDCRRPPRRLLPRHLAPPGLAASAASAAPAALP